MTTLPAIWSVYETGRRLAIAIPLAFTCLALLCLAEVCREVLKINEGMVLQHG
jgi:hypothetical protein